MVAELRRASLSLFGELLFYMTTNAAEQEGGGGGGGGGPLPDAHTCSHRRCTTSMSSNSTLCALLLPRPSIQPHSLSLSLCLSPLSLSLSLSFSLCFSSHMEYLAHSGLPTLCAHAPFSLPCARCVIVKGGEVCLALPSFVVPTLVRVLTAAAAPSGDPVMRHMAVKILENCLTQGGEFGSKFATQVPTSLFLLLLMKLPSSTLPPSYLSLFLSLFLPANSVVHLQRSLAIAGSVAPFLPVPVSLLCPRAQELSALVLDACLHARSESCRSTCAGALVQILRIRPGATSQSCCSAAELR